MQLLGNNNCKPNLFLSAGIKHFLRQIQYITNACTCIKGKHVFVFFLQIHFYCLKIKTHWFLFIYGNLCRFLCSIYAALPLMLMKILFKQVLIFHISKFWLMRLICFIFEKCKFVFYWGKYLKSNKKLYFKYWITEMQHKFHFEVIVTVSIISNSLELQDKNPQLREKQQYFEYHNSDCFLFSLSFYLAILKNSYEFILWKIKL